MAAGQKDIFIAVMGMTGAGKSTFIKRVSGRNDVHVGHTLESATEEVRPYSFKYGGYNFTLIDTPGFDDSRFSDDIVVDKVLKWLKDSAAQDKKLSGIIYMHRIIDPRIPGTARSSMNMFRRLCGPDYFANVVLATTHWSSIDVTRGAERERELCDNDEFWGLLAKKGSKIRRVGYSDREDQKLLLQIANNKASLLQAQEEMRAGTKPWQTAAAREVNDDLTRQAKLFNQQLSEEGAKLQRELDLQNQHRRQQFNARRAAIEEEQRQQEAEELEKQERARRNWQARQQAREVDSKRQETDLKRRTQELARQRKQQEQQQARLEVEQELRFKCNRPPSLLPLLSVPV